MKLFLVGFGPGNYEGMTIKAKECIKNSDIIVGYTVYVDIIKKYFPDKEFFSTPMRKEEERVRAAVGLALEGKNVSIICSGDSVIYGMAGLAYEILNSYKKEYENAADGKPEEKVEGKTGGEPDRKVEGKTSGEPDGKVEGKTGGEPEEKVEGKIGGKGNEKMNVNDIQIEVIPGVTAAVSGSAVLGAVLTHDFCVISLSDLLTPWEKIEKRLECAAMGDFEIAIYNPVSKKRADYLKKACEIILKYRDGDCVCGYAMNIGREEENYQVTTLFELQNMELNMFTTVFIGNSQTMNIDGKMVTPRGYRIDG